MSSIVPLSRSPYRAPGAGEQARGQGRAARPHAERSRRRAPNGGTDQRSGPLTVSAPGPGCVAWAHDDGNERTSWLVRPAGNARREAQRVAGPEARRDEVPGRLRDAAVSEAMRMARWPARRRSTKADRPGGHRRRRWSVSRPKGGNDRARRAETRAAGLRAAHDERGPGLPGETPRSLHPTSEPRRNKAAHDPSRRSEDRPRCRGAESGGLSRRRTLRASSSLAGIDDA